MGKHIAQLISSDGRQPIERMRRSELLRIADIAGIPHPPDMPSYVWHRGQIVGGLVMLLRANGVDVTDPKYKIPWETVTHRDSGGNVIGVESYPVRELHASAKLGVDAEAIRDKKVAELKAEKERQAKEEDRDKKIADLEAENRRLNAVIEERLAKLESKTEPEEIKQTIEIPEDLAHRPYWELMRLAQKHDLWRKGMKKPDLVESLRNGEIPSKWR